MIVGTSFPFLEVFWEMLIFFGFVIWIWLLFVVFGDIFRRHDTSGGMKVLWIVLIVVLPYFGVFIYLIAEQKGMAERSLAAKQQAEDQFSAYVKQTASASDPAEQIAKAKGLLDSGAISQAEFDSIKQRALAGA